MARTQLSDRIRLNTTTDENGCWIWKRYTARNGYGMIGVGSRTDGTRNTALAHRVAYQEFVGDIPDGLQIDHLCKIRNCVNPKHLEAVTPKENVSRSDAYYKVLMGKTECPHGHQYSEENLYVYPTKFGGVKRNCKTCMKQRTRHRYVEKKLALMGAF